MRSEQKGGHFACDIFKCISLNENMCILVQISLKCVSKAPMDSKPSLVQVSINELMTGQQWFMYWLGLGLGNYYIVNWTWLCSQRHDRDHFLYVPSQWETTLQCNVVSHWLGTYTKWYLHDLVLRWTRWNQPWSQWNHLTYECNPNK